MKRKMRCSNSFKLIIWSLARLTKSKLTRFRSIRGPMNPLRAAIKSPLSIRGKILTQFIVRLILADLKLIIMDTDMGTIMQKVRY